MFTPEVAEKIGYYVYRLVDPANSQTFYVGKGRGNRAFAHARGAKLAVEDTRMPMKIEMIKAIHAAGFEVGVIIHRHGLEEDCAFEVEAALIDAYSDLSNEIRGKHAHARGMIAAEELLMREQAEVVRWQHSALLVGVNRTAEARGYYEASRFAWPVSLSSVGRIQFVMAVKDRLIREVFIPHEWLAGTFENFPNAPQEMPERLGFNGSPAAAEIRALYIGKRLPDELQLSQKGVRYIRP